MNILKLTSLAKSAKARSIVSLFDQKERINDFSLSTPHLYLDYSKQNINEVELNGLIEIAEAVGLSESITKQFDGDKINNTEGRSVLHTVLRAPQSVKQQVLGEPLAVEVETTEQQMAKIVEDVQTGVLTGYTAVSYTHLTLPTTPYV